MLLYDRALSMACLRELAEMMADERVVSDRQLESEVAACAARLEQHYGKRLNS